MEIFELDMRRTEKGYIRLTQGWKNLDDKPSVLVHRRQINNLIKYLKKELDSSE